MGIEGLTSKHLAKGSNEPPPPPAGKIRLYNMRFCPFAQRALLTLLYKKLPFEVVNVNLVDKPDWLLKKNPLGKVPIIEQDGKIVYESLVCADYLEETFPKTRRLLPDDPYERAKQRILLERLSALLSSTMALRQNSHDQNVMKKFEDTLDLYEKLLQNDYFAGDQPGYVDFMSWPWVERLGGLEILTEGKAKVRPERTPKLAAYIERMRKTPEVAAYILDGNLHAQFIKGYVAGNIDYEIASK